MPFSGAKYKDVSLSGEDVEKLIRSGNGRACMYYLCLLSTGRDSVAAIAGMLGWSREEALAARTALEALGFCPPLSNEPPESDSLPIYTTAEINDVMDGDPVFKSLVEYTGRRLNKILTPTDLRILLGLYNHLGMPAGVLMLLISYTVERVRKKRGETARVGMSHIEREGYHWHRHGIVTELAAEEYIRKKNDEDRSIASLARLLNIRDRAPTPTEEKYLSKWVSFGMDDEVIYSAYDKTVVNTGSLRWSYMNSILEDWHLKGIKKVSDISGKDRPVSRRPSPYGGKGDPAGPPGNQASPENAAERLKRLRNSRNGKT
jgi:DnaD/phage-associated family protein